MSKLNKDQINVTLYEEVSRLANENSELISKVEEMQKALDKSRKQATTFLNSKIDVSNERHHLNHENAKLRQANEEMQKTLEWIIQYEQPKGYEDWDLYQRLIRQEASKALKGVETK
jgi:cell division septum initiation protein DivIVA